MYEIKGIQFDFTSIYKNDDELPEDSLFDTELVRLKDSSKLKLLIFDTLIFDGKGCINEPYIKRVEMYRDLQTAYERVKGNFAEETASKLFK